MRLKVFSGKSVQAVMSDIRTELGPDAIIMSTVNNRDGVLVTAAVEQIGPAASRETPPPVAVRDAAEARNAVDLDSLKRVIDFHRLPEKLAQNLLRTTLSMDIDEGIFSLSGALDTMFSFRPLLQAPEHPLMLVGPPGAGKSVTAAKLAARAVLAGYDCLLISTDGMRSGASAQLAGFAERLRQPHLTVASGAQLAAAIEDQGQGRAVFIDSLGINPFKPDERAMLNDLLGKTEVEPVLTLPAGLDAEDAAEMASALRGIGIRHMVGTRLDTGRRLGGLIAAAHAAGLYFSDVTSSPYIGDGLDALNPITLARLMVHCSGARTATANRREAAK